MILKLITSKYPQVKQRHQDAAHIKRRRRLVLQTDLGRPRLQPLQRVALGQTRGIVSAKTGCKDYTQWRIFFQLPLLGIAELPLRQVPGPPDARLLPHGGHGQQHPTTALSGIGPVHIHSDARLRGPGPVDGETNHATSYTIGLH